MIIDVSKVKKDSGKIYHLICCVLDDHNLDIVVDLGKTPGWIEINLPENEVVMAKIENIAKQFNAEVFYPFVCDGFRFI